MSPGPPRPARAPRSPIVATLVWARIGLILACAAVVCTAVACGRYGPPVRPEPTPPSTARATSADPASAAGSAVDGPAAAGSAVASDQDEPGRETDAARDSVADAVGDTDGTERDAETGSAAGQAPGAVDGDSGESSR